MEAEKYAAFVQRWIQVMNQPPVSDRWIYEALSRMDSDEVSKYPNGMPSIRSIYELAVKLEGQAATQN